MKKEYWVMFHTPVYNFGVGIEGESPEAILDSLYLEFYQKSTGLTIKGENGKTFYIPINVFLNTLIEVRPVPEVPF